MANTTVSKLFEIIGKLTVEVKVLEDELATERSHVCKCENDCCKE